MINPNNMLAPFSGMLLCKYVDLSITCYPIHLQYKLTIAMFVDSYFKASSYLVTSLPFLTLQTTFPLALAEIA